MKDEGEPRETVRQAIRAGKLPRRRPDRTWGGTGSGGPCAICGRPVARDEVEIELKFAGDDGEAQDGFHVHVGCLGAWERELARMDGISPQPEPDERAATGVLPKSAPDGRISRRGRNDGHPRRRQGFRD